MEWTWRQRLGFALFTIGGFGGAALAAVGGRPLLALLAFTVGLGGAAAIVGGPRFIAPTMYAAGALSFVAAAYGWYTDASQFYVWALVLLGIAGFVRGYRFQAVP